MFYFEEFTPGDEARIKEKYLKNASGKRYLRHRLNDYLNTEK